MPFSATRDLWLVLKAQNMGQQAMRGFSRDVRQVGDSVQMAHLQASRSALINQMAIQRLSGASQADLLVTQRRIQGIDQEIGAMRTARAEMEENRVSAQKLGSALQGAAGMIAMAGTALTAVGVVGIMGLNNLVQSAVAYEKQSAMTATKVDKFATSVKDIEDIGLRVAKSIGVPFQEIQPALFDIFSSMEIGAKDAEAVLETFAKAAVAGQTDISAVSRATIGILNAFHLPLTDMNHLMDVQFQLVKEGIGTYEEWTQRIGLVTPSAARFGQSVEMMAAALAAATRMGLSAARSGTSVARAMDAMSNPVAVENLKELGIAAADADGNFRPMIDILREFREKIKDLPEEDKIKKILEVFKGAGGTTEARRFLQNMLILPGNIEQFQAIFDTMSKESGSFEQAYATMADTTAIKTELMKNQWTALKINAGQTLQPIFEKIIGWLSTIFKWFNSLPAAQQSFIVKVLAVGVALSLVAGILLLVLSGLLAFAAAAAMAGASLFIVLGIITGVGAAFGIFAAAVFLAWQKSSDFRDMVQNVASKLREFYDNTLVPIGRELATTWNEKIVPAFEALARVIEEKVMPKLKELVDHISTEQLKALGELARLIKDGLIWAMENLAGLITNDIIPAIKWLTLYYEAHKEEIWQVIDALTWLAKWLGIIALLILSMLAVAIGIAIVSFMILIETILLVVNQVLLLIAAFNWVKQKIAEFWDWLNGKLNTVTLHGVGEAMMNGLINGIWSRIDALKNTILSIGANAVIWFKNAIASGSPSKKFMELGEASMDGYILGLKKTLPAVKAQVTSSADEATNAVGLLSNGRGGTGANQTINVYTQEINPRRNATELGWLLNGRS